MTNDEIIAVVTAHKNGKQIQYNRSPDNVWTDARDNQPGWNFFEFNYRVKPEPRELRIVQRPDGTLCLTPACVNCGEPTKEEFERGFRLITFREILTNE